MIEVWQFTWHFQRKDFLFHLFFSIAFLLLISMISIILYYFPSLGSFVFSFLVSQGENGDLWLNTSLFSDRSIKCCKFPSEHFRQVPQSFISCIFIFMRFNVYYFIILRLPLWPMEYLKVHWLVSNCLKIYFSFWFLFWFHQGQQILSVLFQFV